VPRAKRGEIWMADLGLAAKVRPVLVLSVAYEGQERTIVSYVIRTTSLRDTQYEVRHETRGMPNGAFDAQDLGSYQRSNSKGEWDTSTPRRAQTSRPIGR
jgi:mRNA interferase MazF